MLIMELRVVLPVVVETVESRCWSSFIDGVNENEDATEDLRRDRIELESAADLTCTICGIGCGSNSRIHLQPMISTGEFVRVVDLFVLKRAHSLHAGIGFEPASAFLVALFPAEPTRAAEGGFPSFSNVQIAVLPTRCVAELAPDVLHVF
jgi:hypothetical protein